MKQFRLKKWLENRRIKQRMKIHRLFMDYQYKQTKRLIDRLELSTKDIRFVEKTPVDNSLNK